MNFPSPVGATVVLRNPSGDWFRKYPVTARLNCHGGCMLFDGNGRWVVAPHNGSVEIRAPRDDEEHYASKEPTR